MLRCTLIATDAGLALALPEVEAVAALPCLRITAALGDLTDERIHHVCGPGEVLWYAGHMTAAGIPLANRDCLPPVVLAAYVAAFEYRLVVLNSCWGAEAAAAIHRIAPGAAVVYHEQEVEDSDAYHLGCLLAQQVCAEGIEGAIAFARVTGYKILDAEMAYGAGPTPELIQVLYALRERVVRIEEKMMRMEEDVRSLRQQPQNLSTRQLLAVAGGCFLALVALALVIAVLSGGWPGAL